MTEPGKTCSHGRTWDEPCRECQLVWDRELVRRWRPVVEEAEQRIAEEEERDREDAEEVSHAAQA